MERKPITEFFDSKVQKIAGKDNSTIYKMNNETGEGIITQYTILPGIELFYNDFHMSNGQNQNKLPHADVLELNHCKEGRFECRFTNGNYQYIGSGDLAINRLTNQTVSTSFPLSHYHGISITIDLWKANAVIQKIGDIIGEFRIDLFSIANGFCKDDTCAVIRNQNKINHIFSELYCTEPHMPASYLKIKVLELLIYLGTEKIQNTREMGLYFSHTQVTKIKEIQNYMTSDLKEHYTLEQLSDKFDIPLTSMKTCFKGVFGCSIYAYMKSYRMQAATVLLRNSDCSITEIALKMGYDNPSKFSEVFKKEYGITPSEFRKEQMKTEKKTRK